MNQAGPTGVRGESNANADDYLGDIADDFLTSADGDRLTGDIDTNLEAVLQNALGPTMEPWNISGRSTAR